MRHGLFGIPRYDLIRENSLTQWLYDMRNTLKEVATHPHLYPGGTVVKFYLLDWRWRLLFFYRDFGTCLASLTAATYCTLRNGLITAIDALSCQFNNGGVSIMQNDRKRLLLGRDRRYCRLWRCDHGSNGCVNTSDLLGLLAPVDSVKESLDLIRHFVEYMDANLMTVSGIRYDY